MSNWGFVAIAYTLVWGSVAIYALVLARRVAQARQVTQILQQSLQNEMQAVEEDGTVCDTPPAP
ncbi:MAG TPA: hypothetical protein VIO57_11135 [Chloroflexota bacterium]